MFTTNQNIEKCQLYLESYINALALDFEMLNNAKYIEIKKIRIKQNMEFCLQALKNIDNMLITFFNDFNKEYHKQTLHSDNNINKLLIFMQDDFNNDDIALFNKYFK